MDELHEQKLMDELRKEINSCNKCVLGCGAKKRVIFSHDYPPSPVKFLFVGEAPGADEDEIGYPFVGKSGELLRTLLDEASFTTEELTITNIVHCRPPANRKPQDDEVEACRDFMIQKIRLVQPQYVVAVGREAVAGLIGFCRGGITELSGKWIPGGPPWSYGALGKMKYDVQVYALVHPAYILRNRNELEKYVTDIFKLRKMCP